MRRVRKLKELHVICVPPTLEYLTENLSMILYPPDAEYDSDDRVIGYEESRGWPMLPMLKKLRVEYDENIRHRPSKEISPVEEGLFHDTMKARDGKRLQLLEIPTCFDPDCTLAWKKITRKVDYFGCDCEESSSSESMLSISGQAPPDDYFW